MAIMLLYLELSLFHNICPPKPLIMKQMHAEHSRDKDVSLNWAHVTLH